MSDSKPLDGKVALVTGAARGIGRGIALVLAERGATVVVADMDADQASATAEAAGNGSTGLALNVADREAVDAAVAEVVERHGKIDILVNNAGINRDAMLWKMTDEQWDDVIAVDLSGVFYMCRAVGAHMRQQKYGRIVNISSASWMGNIGQTNYAAAKAGVVGLTRSIAKELARSQITANAICPGFIETDMTRGMPENLFAAQLDKIPLQRAGQPEDVARVVAFLASDDAAYVTGEVVNVGGGYKL
ncbi:3-oxoacyl-[acyl-carrier-protein] reductase [Georgenia soli]|uniref:3-oxoacyl-[acyl-carrier-protein] reductase n=1 Tax=Georgenia soli TaxID=638953 RepID=A0A2A9EJQ7_9MICO|nr:3-oxoacyl-ACP reductase FabG [Georgenia soli]PFG39053.1 3-oxoacyl-[acyl-carrier-protein] reductase [Georgenia soli]